MVPGQFFIWGVTLLGLWAAFTAGNMIADEGYQRVLLYGAAVLTLLAVITVRRYWWIPVFVIGGVGFSTAALGFKMDGTDLLAAFGFICLLAMLGMGQLKSKNTQRNLGIFFYLLLGYVAFHAALYGLDNYFNGDTQFKNIAKRYYFVVVPLILIWCMDRFSYKKGLRTAIHVMMILSVIFSIVGVVVTLLGIELPIISGDMLNFQWAGAESANGYLRWIILPIILLALCLISSTQESGLKLFYRGVFLMLLPACFFGGGRIAIVMILLFLLVWLALRKKWQEIFIGGWVLLIGAIGMLVLGHTLDARSLQGMPESFKNVQRAISIFLPSDQVNDEEVMTAGSDQWHKDLAIGALDYTNEDYQSMIIGHGFKGWDDNIDFNFFSYGDNYRSSVKIAIRMGQSETMFFSILPIFGWIGVLLYYGFMIEFMRRTLHVRKLCPEGSLARSLCEFSFTLILVTLLVSPLTGAIPSYNMIYWMLGFIAAEPYIFQTLPKV